MNGWQAAMEYIFGFLIWKFQHWLRRGTPVTKEMVRMVLTNPLGYRPLCRDLSVERFANYEGLAVHNEGKRQLYFDGKVISLIRRRMFFIAQHWACKLPANIEKIIEVEMMILKQVRVKHTDALEKQKQYIGDIINLLQGSIDDNSTEKVREWNATIKKLSDCEEHTKVHGTWNKPGNLTQRWGRMREKGEYTDLSGSPPQLTTARSPTDKGFSF